MKGLLVKDFQVLRTNRQIVVVILGMFAFFGLIQDGGIPFLVGYVTIICGMLVNNTISYDELDHGYSFLFTLPITKKLYVQEKYVLGFILTTAGWLLSSAVSTLIYMWKQPNIDWVEWGTSLGAFVIIIVVLLSILIPIQLKFGGEKGRIALIGVTVGIFAIGAAIVGLINYFNIDLSFIHQSVNALGGVGVMSVLVVILLCMLILSYLASLKIMNKKQF